MDALLKQLGDLKDSLLNKEAEYNHLAKLNSIFLKDVDDLKVKVKVANRIADEADLLKSNFLANMSHEIRTPMNGILGFAQILKKEELERDLQHRYLDIISHNGNVLINLIDDIIDLSKIEAGQLSFTKTVVNLDNLMLDLFTFYDEVRVQQEKAHLGLKLKNFNEEEQNHLLVDSQRLHQVISNLLNNAIKFTHKGQVEFGYKTKKGDRFIEFYVRDTGIGIPEDMQQNIFDKFRQVEEGSTRMYGGTGIGLFISKHIVEMMGGSIRVESVVGEGSVFTFSIPYEEIINKDGVSSVFAQIEKSYNWENRQIVIADDVDTNFKFLNAILSKTKASIVWMKDGEEVVQYCKENNNVDLVLMDIQMPKIDGIEATKRIKKLNKQIIIVAQTAYALPNDNIKCIQAGCDDYIAKPINADLLLEKLDTFLGVQAKV